MYPGTFAATTPDKPAVVMGRSGAVVTYRELDERSARLAQLLYARGLRPGDKVAILAENHPRFYEVYWAVMRSGLYLTTVNRYLAPAEAAYLVNDSGATRVHHHDPDGADGSAHAGPHSRLLDPLHDGRGARTASNPTRLGWTPTRPNPSPTSRGEM